jgi:hypothetical protein
MTKAENRAAAKAYQQEKLRKWREEARAAGGTSNSWPPCGASLHDAIDDYAERLTGGRCMLSIGGSRNE